MYKNERNISQSIFFDILRKIYSRVLSDTNAIIANNIPIMVNKSDNVIAYYFLVYILNLTIHIYYLGTHIIGTFSTTIFRFKDSEMYAFKLKFTTASLVNLFVNN